MNLKPILPYSPDELEVCDITPGTLHNLSTVQRDIGREPLHEMVDSPPHDAIAYQTGAIISNTQWNLLTGTGGNLSTTSVILVGSWAKTPLEIARNKLKGAGALSVSTSLSPHFYLGQDVRGIFAMQIGHLVGSGKFESDQWNKRTPKRRFSWEDPQTLLSDHSITGVDRIILEALYN